MLDWSKCGKGAVVKFRCGGANAFKEYALPMVF